MGRRSGDPMGLFSGRCPEIAIDVTSLTLEGG
jgi:hypothetical protein